MKFIKSHLKLSIKLLVLSLLIIGLILFIILKMNPDICEYWTQTFVKWHVFVFGAVNMYLPFSLTEIIVIGLVVLAIVFLVFCLIHLFKKRRAKSLHAFLNVAIIIFSLVTMYQVTAEMAYNRHPVDTPLYQQKVDKTDFKTIINYFIDDLNECCNHLTFSEDGNLVEPYDFFVLNDQLKLEYEKYPKGYLFDFTTRCKPMATSFLYREFHITGVTFLPLGEANINYMNVSAGKPFTFAHELAHTKGAMREGDADLVATYITLNSNDYYIRYSGYYYTFGSLFNLANYTGVAGDYSELYNRLDARFINNIKYNNAYWKEHSLGVQFAEWWNNLYLIISGQKEGTDSYGDHGGSTDPSTHEIKTFSNYQKLYFYLYYKDTI